MRLFTRHKLREQDLETRDTFVRGLGFGHLPYRGMDDLTHVDHWDSIKALLAQIDWPGWSGHLEGLDFSVYQYFYLDLYPSLKATRRKQSIAIEVGLATRGPDMQKGWWSEWYVKATVEAQEVLPEIHGFKFIFDRGWNGRAIYGGGAWFVRELPQGLAPILPPVEKLGQLIAEQETKAQDLVALLTGLG